MFPFLSLFLSFFGYFVMHTGHIDGLILTISNSHDALPAWICFSFVFVDIAAHLVDEKPQKEVVNKHFQAKSPKLTSL